MNEPATLLTATESWLQRYQRRILFSQLKHGYEIASGFKVAREEVLLALKHIQTDGNHLDTIRESVERDLKQVRTALLDVQRLYNEIAASITTAVAARTVLNRQRMSISDLHQGGLLDVNEYKKLKGSVECQMKTLTYHPPIVAMPNKMDILGQIPWLECVSPEELSTIASSFEDAVFQRGDVLVKQDEKSDSVHVLARGTVAVSYQTESGEHVEIDELGMGSVFGEISWALNSLRGASIVATSPGLLFTIRGETLRTIAEENAELEKGLWETCGRRLSENVLATISGKSRQQIREMVQEMDLHTVDPMNKKLQFYVVGSIIGSIILLRGTAIMEINGTSELIEAPGILPSGTNTNDMTLEAEFSTDAKFMCHPLALEGHALNSYERKDHRAFLEIKKPNIFLGLQDKVLARSDLNLPGANGQEATSKKKGKGDV